MADRLPRDERIRVRHVRKKVDGDWAQLLEVENAEMGEVIMRCFIGDDAAVEGVADFLAARRYPKAAEEVRRLVVAARKGK